MSQVIRYPGSAFGYDANSPGDGGGVSEPFIASEAITKGFAVELDTSGTYARVKTATTNGGTQLFVGIAQDGATAAGESILVTMFGHAVARVATTVTAGDRLSISSTTAGLLASITAGVAVSQSQHLGTVRAVALETVTTAANTACKVLVVRI